MSTIGNDETWSTQKSKLKLKFAELTDSDLLFVNGKREEIIAKLQIILGKTQGEVEEILNNI